MELAPEIHEFTSLRVIAAGAGDAVEVGLTNVAEVVLPLHLLRMASDCGHCPRVLQGFAEVLHGVSPEGLKEVLPRRDARLLEHRPESAVLVAVTRAVHLALGNDENIRSRASSVNGFEQVIQLGVKRDHSLLTRLRNALGEREQPTLPVDHPPFCFEGFSLAESAKALEGEEASPAVVAAGAENTSEEFTVDVVPAPLDLPRLSPDASKWIADKDALMHRLIEEAPDVAAVVGDRCRCESFLPLHAVLLGDDGCAQERDPLGGDGRGNPVDPRVAADELHELVGGDAVRPASFHPQVRLEGEERLHPIRHRRSLANVSTVGLSVEFNGETLAQNERLTTADLILGAEAAGLATTHRVVEERLPVAPVA